MLLLQDLRTLAAMCLVLWLGTSPAEACGWNDYDLELGDGYSIVHCNSLDVVIAREGLVILSPQDFAGVGPVVAYQMGDQYLLTKNAGRKARNLFANDEFEQVDERAEWYFLIPKRTGRPMGPFARDAFERALRERGLTGGDWKQPRNATFATPLVLIASAVFVTFPLFAVFRRMNGWVWKRAGWVRPTPDD